ncbi:C40 family peptidase, partial [Salmonella enterica]|uniref:C40 family peptidase n=1 Tax=Salmonella enterica TaxID=28901 RepID=UPI000A762076
FSGAAITTTSHSPLFGGGVRCVKETATADHVGVYVGNGKFIQSPRSGQEIKITSLNEEYWQRHYVGARRVMTPKTIR